MLLLGVTLLLALSAPVKNAVDPALPPPPPPPGFGVAAVLKIVDTVRNFDIADLVGAEPPPPPPPPPQGFGAVFAQVLENPLSLIPSSSDLVGLVDHVYTACKTATIPSTSDVIAAVGGIRNVNFKNLRQHFQAIPPPPPPPPPSFPSKAWFRKLLRTRVEQPPPPPPPSSWARLYLLFDFGAVIAKVRSTPPPSPPPPLSRWEQFINEYTTGLDNVRGKLISVSQGFWSIVSPVAANTTAQTAPAPLENSPNSKTINPLSWLKSVHVPPSSGILDETRGASVNAANPTMSGIPVDNYRMGGVGSFCARVVDLASTSIGMQLFRAAPPKGDIVDLRTGATLDEPTQSHDSPGLSMKSLLQVPLHVEQETSILDHIRTGLCNMMFWIGFALGYTHGFLNDIFPESKTWNWMQFSSYTCLFFVLLFLWNNCINHWAQLEMERRAVEEEEKKRKENPPKADSSFYYWTRYTPAQEQAILDAAQ